MSGESEVPGDHMNKLLQGYPVGVGMQAWCTSCKCGLGEGEAVYWYAYKPAGGEQWDVPTLFCERCGDGFAPIGTLGCDEYTGYARLEMATDPHRTRASLVLHEVRAQTHSSAEDGRPP